MERISNEDQRYVKMYNVTFWPLSSLFCRLSFPEYDGQLAPAGGSESGMASSSYLEPNLNHSAASGCGVKSRSVMPGGTGGGTSGSAGGLERPSGSMDRVLKIFHYFETNSEPCTWASNIRHGDATDVRVRRTHISYHSSPPSSAFLWFSWFLFVVLPLISTGCYSEDSRDPQVALCVLSGPPSDPSALWCTPLVTPWFGRVSHQRKIWETAPPGGMEVRWQHGLCRPLPLLMSFHVHFFHNGY